MSRASRLAVALPFLLVSLSVHAQTFVYTNEDLPTNVVSGFKTNPDGSLTALAGSPFATLGSGGSGGFYATNKITAITRKFLFASNSADGSVSAFAIDAATGALALVSGSPFAASSPFGLGISLAATPDGAFLYAGAAHNLHLYGVGPTGALTQLAGSPLTVGGEIDGMKVAPNGKFLLVNLPASGGTAVFAIASDGSLSSVAGSPFASGPASASVDVTCASDLAFVPSFSSGPTHVEALALSPAGALTPIAGSPFTFSGTNSNVAVLSPDDKLLFVSNQYSNSLTVLNVAPGGTLTEVAGSPFAVPLTPIGMGTDAAGKFLYVAAGPGEFGGGPHQVMAYGIGPGGTLAAVPGSPFLTGAPVGTRLDSLAVFPPKTCLVPAATAFTLGPATCTRGRTTSSIAGLYLTLSDKLTRNACADALACSSYANANEITVSIQNMAGPGKATAIGPGTYKVGFGFLNGGTLAVGVYVGSTNATCGATMSSATGTITLTSTGNPVTGSYNLVVRTSPTTSQTYAGTFSASNCGAAAANACTASPFGTCSTPGACIQ